MKTYSKFQIGWLIFIVLIPVLVISYLCFKYQWGTNPPDIVTYIILVIVFASILLIFFGMKVSVDETKIKVSFGIGLISITIKINEIKSVEIVRNPWYYGWGIRFIPHGMLYNITGKQAIELKFKNSKKIIRIGSAHPEELKNAIEANLFPKN